VKPRQQEPRSLAEWRTISASSTSLPAAQPWAAGRLSSRIPGCASAGQAARGRNREVDVPRASAAPPPTVCRAVSFRNAPKQPRARLSAWLVWRRDRVACVERPGAVLCGLPHRAPGSDPAAVGLGRCWVASAAESGPLPVGRSAFGMRRNNPGTVVYQAGAASRSRGFHRNAAGQSIACSGSGLLVRIPQRFRAGIPTGARPARTGGPAVARPRAGGR